MQLMKREQSLPSGQSSWGDIQLRPLQMMTSAMNEINRVMLQRDWGAPTSGVEGGQRIFKEENIDLELRIGQPCKVLEIHLKGENNDCKDSGAGRGKGLCLEFGGTD